MWTKEALKAKHENLLDEYRVAMSEAARALRDAARCEATCLGAQQVAQAFYGVADLTLTSAEDLQRIHPEAPPLAELAALYREHAPGGVRAAATKLAATEADSAFLRALAALEATENLARGLYDLTLHRPPPPPPRSPAAAPAANTAQAEPCPGLRCPLGFETP